MKRNKRNPYWQRIAAYDMKKPRQLAPGLLCDLQTDILLHNMIVNEANGICLGICFHQPHTGGIEVSAQ